MAFLTGLVIWVTHMIIPVPIGKVFLVDTTHFEEEDDQVDVEPLEMGDKPFKTINPPNAYDHLAFMSSGRSSNDLTKRRHSSFEFSRRFSTIGIPTTTGILKTPSIASLNEESENTYDNPAFQGDKLTTKATIVTETTSLRPKESPPNYSRISLPRNSISQRSVSFTPFTAEYNIEEEDVTKDLDPVVEVPSDDKVSNNTDVTKVNNGVKMVVSNGDAPSPHDSNRATEHTTSHNATSHAVTSQNEQSCGVPETETIVQRL